MPYLRSDLFKTVEGAEETSLPLNIKSPSMNEDGKFDTKAEKVEHLEKVASDMEAKQMSEQGSHAVGGESKVVDADRANRFDTWKDAEEDQDKPPSESNYASSRPPSPPDSGVRYRRLSIAPCPLRLTPFYPPVNFGAVEIGTIFRSGFPSNRNLEFLEKLNIKAMITLDNFDYFETEEAYAQIPEFLRRNGIKHISVSIKPNKKRTGSAATPDSICEVLCYAMNPENHPVYIHCNHGRHRSGCVVACLRKIQRYPLDEIIQEYKTYASPKPRDDDIEFITNFDPAVVYEFAKSRGMLESWPREKRADSAVDIWDLATALPVHGSHSAYTSSESGSEDGLFIPHPSTSRIASTGKDERVSTPVNTGSATQQMAGLTLKEVVDEADLPPSQQVTPRAGTKAPVALATNTTDDGSPKSHGNPS